MDEIIKYCECCGRKIEIAFGSSKYCKRCSLYIFNLQKERGIIKHQLKMKNQRIKKLEAKILLKNDKSMY